MISFLRFLGVTNAAIWFGAAIFVTFFGGPAFFSPDMIAALKHRYYAGQAAEIFLSRYFILHYVCASLALAHLLAEWLYLGRRLTNLTRGLWAVLAALILFGGLVMQPHLRQLHQTMYWAQTPALRARATFSFRIWHGVSQGANLLVTAGLLVYFWRIAPNRRNQQTPEL